jgi:SPP1 gp7 family putative phage head morphogenesis protein
MALSEVEARRLAERFDRLLLQLDKEQAKALIAELRKAQESIVGQLVLAAAAEPQLTWNSVRMQNLLRDIEATIADLERRMSSVVLLYPERATALADQYATKVLQAKVYGAFGVLNRPALAALQEYNFGLIRKLTDDLKGEIRSVITQGVIQGHGIPQIARQLTTGTALQKGTFAKVETRARVIARTETIRAFSHGVQWQFALHGIKRVQWMTARDERVCEWCGPLDGLIFPLDQLPLGGPPIHPQCRCFIRPVIAATEDEGKVLDLEAERNVREQRKRFEDAAAKRKKRKGAA